MGFTAKACSVVGITMTELFKNIYEVSNTFDEYDKYGNITGNKITENKLLATLFDNTELIISEKKTTIGWKFDWLNSIGFEDDVYVGDVHNLTVKLHYGCHDVFNLNDIIIGLEVAETKNSDHVDDLVSIIDPDITNTAINRTRKELYNAFGYIGNINIYLINKISY